MNEIRIGYVLNANTLGCTAGCRMSQISNPEFGKMVAISAHNQIIIYGIIANVHILDDGLVRQLATTQPIEERIIRDNRDNRIIPLEFSIIFLGFTNKEKISHLLPPNPRFRWNQFFHAPIRIFWHSQQPAMVVICATWLRTKEH
jgi:hypothetical protein